MNPTAFMDNLKHLFAECDTDNNGSLGRGEFMILCQKIGLNQEAANETFDRLDSDNNERITFSEFAAGFNQYSKSASTSPQPPVSANNNNNTSGSNNNSQPSTSSARHSSRPATPPRSSLSSPRSPTAGRSSKLSPTSPPTSGGGPVAARARKNVSPLGVLSLGSTGSSGNLNSSHSGGSGSVLRGSSSTSGLAGTSIQESSGDYLVSTGEVGNSNNNGTGNGGKDDSMVVYSSDAFGDYGDQSAGGSGQYGSLMSSCGSLGQMRNMQDLLDCVQKLQSENQILSQIFFKDKREREEYISQLGEEFDQQVREVEERANRRAREELENEKRRLREMMAAERETLQHHYQTIERMSKLVKSPNGKLEDGETFDRVKSKLEDTFIENRRLKQSLHDTKSEVGMIWKEMEKLKKQYEDKLSSAFEKNTETKSECDHIKQQLSLMKDSNKKLQDASDVITSYITEKVEPVIKVATGEDGESSGPSSFNMIHSQANSRRGSILSEYLNTGTGNEPQQPTSLDGHTNGSVNSVDLESFGSSNARGGESRSGASSYNRPGGGDEADNESISGGSSSGNHQIMSNHLRVPKSPSPYKSQLEQQLRQNKIQEEKRKQQQLEAEAKAAQKMQPNLEDELKAHETNDGLVGTEANSNSINDLQKSTVSMETTTKPTEQQRPLQQDYFSKIEQSKSSASLASSTDQQQAASAKPAVAGGIRNFGRSFFIGSRAQSDAKIEEQKQLANKTELAAELVKQSQSVDNHDEPLVEPADGPSKATFNIILVGDSFVGKSSFAARFMEGSFVQGLISNCSIDFKTKAYKVDGINYTVNLWDTAGQERFRSITASYFRKADGIILMYDVTDKRSYLNVRNWMSTISDTAAENVAVLLVGNKIDLRLKHNMEKCVPLEEGARLAKEYDIVFLETSVKTGINLVPSMGRLIRLIAKNNMPDEEDDDRIRLNDKNRTFNCMPKNC